MDSCQARNEGGSVIGAVTTSLLGVIKVYRIKYTQSN